MKGFFMRVRKCAHCADRAADRAADFAADRAAETAADRAAETAADSAAHADDLAAHAAARADDLADDIADIAAEISASSASPLANRIAAAMAARERGAVGFIIPGVSVAHQQANKRNWRSGVICSFARIHKSQWGFSHDSHTSAILSYLVANSDP
jgi:hypothetical protein